MPDQILIVEDDERIASMLRRGLIFEGFDAVVAPTGPAALEQARQRMPDLVVLDLMLPEIDGMEVCRRLRAAGDVPILMLTAKEYDLLELFMRHPRQVLTRDQIFDQVWGYDFGGESNIIEVYVRYLRTKLETEGEDRLIHTVRSVGYALREPT